MLKRPLLQWIKANSVILFNAGSLIATTGVTSVLGLAYWWFAARRFPPEAVGLASAGLSTMTLLGTLCMTGMGTLLIGELGRQPGKEMSLISASLILVGTISGLPGIAFAIFAPYISPDLRALGTSVQSVALFSIGVSLTAITLAVDQALIGLLKGGLQLWRNALFAVLKLVALFIVGLWLNATTGLSIYTTWTIGNALSLTALAVFTVLKGRRPIKSYWPDWGLLKKLRSMALQHQMLNLVLQAPGLILPLLVTVLLSAEMNAWFYVAAMIANFVSVATLALTTVLYAANSAQPAALAQKARLTIGLSLATCLMANIVCQFGTRQILGVFGQSYADQASWSLRILVMGSIPLIIKDHYIAIRRIQKRIAQAMLPLVAGGILELAGAAAGARLGGLSGLSLGWLVAVCIEAVYMFLPVYKAIYDPDISVQPEAQSSEVEPEMAWLTDTLALPSVNLKQTYAAKYERYRRQVRNNEPASHLSRIYLRLRQQDISSQDTQPNEVNLRK